jgi:hypothetical protein
VKIRNIKDRLTVTFSPDTPVQPRQIDELHQMRKSRLKYLPDGFEISAEGSGGDEILRDLLSVIEELHAGREASPSILP